MKRGGLSWSFGGFRFYALRSGITSRSLERNWMKVLEGESEKVRL